MAIRVSHFIQLATRCKYNHVFDMIRMWASIFPLRRIHQVKYSFKLICANTLNLRTMSSGNNGNDITEKRARIDGPLTIGTHSTTFHCDEVLACFMLKQLPEYENANILRSRNDEELFSKCDIIVDVGGKFNPEKKYFDHHQSSFKETLCSLRPELGAEFNKIRLSSAGLIYTFYGERVIDVILQKHAKIKLNDDNLRLAFIQIYRNFIVEIDAIDNGVQMFEGGEPLYTISTHLSARVGKLNVSWEEENVTDKIIDERFQQAMTLVGNEFVDNVLSIGGSWIKARDYVREALDNAKNIYKTGEILKLPRFCPWKAHLFDLEEEYKIEVLPKLVIFKEKENSWRVQGVPVTPCSYLGRKFLPKEWRGLRDEELSKTAGIDDLIFVHHTGFIGGAKTEAAALQMAIKSVEWPSS